MKLDDIRLDLNKEIILYQKKEIINHTKEQLKNSIDNISPNKAKDIIITSNKEISINKLNKKLSIDGLKSDKYYNKNINLYKNILNSSSIFKLKYVKDKLKLKNNKKLLSFQKNINKLRNKLNYYNIAIFLSIIILFSIFDKYYIEYLIKSGINNLGQIQYATNLSEVKKNISDSRLDFTIAKYCFLPFTILPIDEIQNINNIIKIGKETTYLLDNSITIYINTNNYILNKSTISTIGITGLLSKEQNNINKIGKNIHTIKTNLEKLTTKGKLKPYKDKLYSINNYIAKIDIFFDYINNNFETFLEILGNKESKTYLIVFQNNDEIRATGGFMGSVGLLKIKNGDILNFEKKDIYALEWDINKNYHTKISPPNGLKNITNSFGLRDSNYFPDFRESANSINFFMNKSKYNINGVVFVNMLPLLNLLKENNGLYFEQIQKHINNNNFAEIISFLVETKKFKKGTLGTPKKILFDFILELTEDLKNKKDYISYIKIFEKALKNRELVIHLFNKNENILIQKLGLNGNINYNNFLDFNYPIYTSIGGNKTDRYISRKYKKNIIINKNCRIDTQLDIILQHNFTDIDKTRIINMFDEYKIKYNQDILNISGAGKNISYTRVLLPKNANVFLKEGQKLIKKENYSIVEFTTHTKSGQSSNYHISYYIKNKDCKQYNYNFIKQSGLYPYDLEISINNKKIKEIGIDGDYIYNTN